MTVLAAKHIDKGDDIESQYYKYKDNIIKNEKAMNYGCMKFYSFFYDCCKCCCCYNEALTKKIVANRALAKTIKFSQIENASSYKRKAYQYSLSSIMLNNVKNECIELKGLPIKDLLVKDLPDLEEVKVDLKDLKDLEDLKDLDKKIPIINSIRKSFKKLVPGPSPSEKKNVIKEKEKEKEGLGRDEKEEKDAE
jgi:hypothetical protein